MVDVSKTLQLALQQLRADRVKLDRQIARGARLAG